MQKFCEGAFYGQWGMLNDFGSPAPAMSAMRLARLVNSRRCDGPARNTRGLARAIASGTWKAKVVNHHRPNQPPMWVMGTKVPGGYILRPVA